MLGVMQRVMQILVGGECREGGRAGLIERGGQEKDLTLYSE